MNPLDLSPAEFQDFLTEERQYRSPEQIDDLIRRYNAANSLSGRLAGLLEPQEGRRRTNILPASVPVGMSLMEALQSGEAEFAIPQGVVDMLTGTVRGVENPALAAQGRIPASDMNAAGFETAAAAMGLGGLLATKPVGSLGSNALFTRKPDNIMDEFNPETYYHGTRADIDAFDENMVDLGVHVGTKGQANERIQDLIKRDDPVYTSPFDSFANIAGQKPESSFRTGEGPMEGAQILPLKVRANYPLRMPDVGEWDRSEVVMYYIEKMLGEDGDPRLREAFEDFDFDELDNVRDQFYDKDDWKASVENREFLDEIRDRIKDAGYDSIVYRNAVESSRDEGIQDSMIVLDPRNLRSVNAEFDPYFEYSSNLLAANASKGTGALTIAADVSARGDQVLNLLKSGRGSEVTDAMLDMGDSVKNTQLNQYLAANYDLPMDEASRLARAREMGLLDAAYHSTGSDFQNFVPSEFRGASFFAATPEGASKGASASANEGVGSGSKITMPVRVDTSGVEGIGAYARKDMNEFRASLPDRIYTEAEVDALMASDAAPLRGNWSDFFDDLTDYDALRKFRDENPTKEIPDGIVKFRPKRPKSYNKDLKTDLSGRQFAHYSEGMSERPTSEYVKSQGNTGFTMMDESGLALAMVDPTKVRSQFARFDPRLTHLSNLTAANASPLVGLLTQGLSEKQANKIEDYLYRTGLLQ